jgi:DNA repair protein RecN (Recombination protein N)
LTVLADAAAHHLTHLMLRYLRIRNLAVIEQVQVEFEPGLNVLTGETGAGKSVLVEAVGLLLGGRASSDLVRTGEELAQVEAQFLDGGTEVVLRREVTAQGRSRAFVNGSLVTAGALREFSDRLVELHGQHEHQILMDADSHLSLLDSYANLESDRPRVGEAFARLQALRTELQALHLDERQKAARIDLLTFQRDEIARAQIRPGEDEELTATRQVLVNAEKLQRLSGEAYAALYESDGAVLGTLGAIWRRVGELAGLDPRVTPYLEPREAIKSQLEDLAFFLRGYSEDIDTSPARLQEVDDRLVLLERLKRKYGPALAEVLAHHDGAVQELTELANLDARAEVMGREVAAAAAEYLHRAGALSAARRAAADGFAAALETSLGELGMARTRFGVRFDESPATEAGWTAGGVDRAEFLVSPNPGEELRPLARIASGGELSRVMLALRSLSISAGCARALVFDEVDAGIGGRAADDVGRKLQMLGRDAQVLCITHLPQIAACGGAHYRVSKDVRDGRTVAAVKRLADGDRAEELARMMAGGTVTQSVLASARELLVSRGISGPGESEAQAKGESESRGAKGQK